MIRANNDTRIPDKLQNQLTKDFNQDENQHLFLQTFNIQVEKGIR